MSSLAAVYNLVPRLHHAREEGSVDIGADSWFCKLSNHVVICIGLYWSMCGNVMVCKTKKMLQCPQTLSLLRVGSGNETTAVKLRQDG